MIKIIDLRCGKDSDIFENLASRSQLEYRMFWTGWRR